MSEDLIKRSDAIKAIWGDDINPSEDGMVFEAQSHIDRDIRLMPSVEPKHGEWVGDKCSVCGTERAWYGCNPPFCPDCGASMREREGE